MKKKKNTLGKTMAIMLAMAGVLGLAGCGAATNASTNKGNGSNEATQASASFPLTVTDEAGRKVTIAKQPHHIASVTEGTDEILSALVPKGDIAMVTTYAGDPTYSNIVDFAKGIPTIKDADAEQIIAASPDLVLLASYTKDGVVDQIEQAQMPVYEFTNFNSVKDIENNIETVGKLVGVESKAKQLADTLDNKLHAVQDAVKGQKKLSVLDYSSFGYAGGSDTTVNEMITYAGGINAAAALQGWKKISDEEIVKMNPDVIIVADSDKGFDQKLLQDKGLQTVNAIKNHRVYAIAGPDLSSVSQYVINGVRDIAHVLYPDVKLPQ